MIGKITVGKSFRAILNYCLNDKVQELNQELVMKDRAEVLLYNKCFGNSQELVEQFNDMRQLNPKVSKPVLHITLSLDPADRLAKNKLMEISEHCAKDMGFENNQYLAIAHRDTKHQHLHIIANRIGFDKRTVSDSHSYKKIANYCRKMEQKYELKKVLSPKKYLSQEQRNIPRLDQRKERLRENIKQALQQCKHYSQFEQRITEKGYQITKGRGISFTDEKKVKVKGSELNYSLQTIERMIQKQRVFQQKRGSENAYRQIQQGKEVLRENNCSVKEKQSYKVGLLEQLLKPEKQEQMPFMEEDPKKKKKKSLHL